MSEQGEGIMIVVEGIVVEGDHRGRTLGFPTANLEPSRELPPDGVYAGSGGVRVIYSEYVAAISIGHRATYYGDEAIRLLEAHLLDFDGDLYGERITVHVGEFLRTQSSFESSDALAMQIKADIEKVRVIAGQRD